ncbi:MAG: ATP-grasp domain-containing protein [Dehalococcoidia bacterium]
MRVLLLMASRTYRANAFLEAARRLEVDVSVGSDQQQVLSGFLPGSTLTLDFRDLQGATWEIVKFAERHPLHAVVSVEDDATVLAAAASAALSLLGNPVEPVAATRNKHRLRELLAAAGVPSPRYRLLSIDDDPEEVAGGVSFPCVVKPLALSASRGVIRADDEAQFAAAFRRLVAILRQPDVVAAGGEEARRLLVETFVPGPEVALEGLLTDGELRVLAIFDKPDPLEGPYFEETIYVTPSRLPIAAQGEVAACAAAAAGALRLREGPVHVELRLNDEGPWVIEIAARSIGGLCSRALRFGDGVSLEELILRHALGMETESLEREGRSAGVMMIPIPAAGYLWEVRGQEEAMGVSGVEDVVISVPPGGEVVPLPEGTRYLGFIFARSGTPERVEAALRQAHRRLEFIIGPMEGGSGPWTRRPSSRR